MRGRLWDGSKVAWNLDRGHWAPGVSSATRVTPKMQSVMNLKIKYRESFRPFAPSVLRERVSEYFALDADSP